MKKKLIINQMNSYDLKRSQSLLNFEKVAFTAATTPPGCRYLIYYPVLHYIV